MRASPYFDFHILHLPYRPTRCVETILGMQLQDGLKIRKYKTIEKLQTRAGTSPGLEYTQPGKGVSKSSQGMKRRRDTKC